MSVTCAMFIISPDISSWAENSDLLIAIRHPYTHANKRKEELDIHVDFERKTARTRMFPPTLCLKVQSLEIF
jgi:hypothetical protein